MNKTTIQYLIILLIFINLLFAAWLPLHQDINFHTDIARDFLLINDVLTTKKLTLIGPRAGGIPGVFYGPLWLYLNLPVYYFSGGNPVASGWFWVGLYILGSLMYFWILKKLWSVNIALVGTLIYSTILATSIPNSIPHLGAVLLSPLWFYLFFVYLKRQRWIILLISYFILGLMGHFQVAFAGPMMVLQTLFLIPYLYRRKKLIHLLAIFGVLVPLSTFLLFEYRHQYLQIKAIVAFIRGSEIEEKFNLIKNIINRVRAMLFTGHGLLPQPFAYVVLVLAGWLTYLYRCKKTIRQNSVLILFGYFYVGFWLICIFFKGTIWSYYYWPFMPLAIMALMSLDKILAKWWFYLLIGGVYLINLWGNLKWLSNQPSFMGNNNGSWKFHQAVAKEIFERAPAEFGYYVYTPDQYGYSPRYAMQYVGKSLTEKTAFPYTKMPTVYLIMAPDSPNNPYTSAEYWKQEKVKINKIPSLTRRYANGYRIEAYQLTLDEVKIEDDPNLIQDQFFR